MTGVHLNGETSVYGIFGNPIKHSLSPFFQTLLFNLNSINAVYVPFEINSDVLEEAVNSIRVLKIKGINVTIPYKEKIVPYLDELSEESAFLNSVNTIVNKFGKLRGDITDGYGFVKSLLIDANFEVSGKKFLIFGLGGAARSIVFSLAKYEAEKIYVSSRSYKKVREYTEKINEYFGKKIVYPVVSYSEDFYKFLLKVDAIVNTSPLGLKESDPMPFDLNKCNKKALICDIIYNPETKLLKLAKKMNFKTLDGLGMLLFQGMKSFKLWTGIDTFKYYEVVKSKVKKLIRR